MVEDVIVDNLTPYGVRVFALLVTCEDFRCPIVIVELIPV